MAETEMMTDEPMPQVELRCRYCGWAEHPTNNVRFSEDELLTDSPLCTCCEEDARRLREQREAA
jgi:hypothetical protein